MAAVGFPPLPFDQDAALDDLELLPFFFRRYLNSRFCLLAPEDVQGLALKLLCTAMEQRPLGTLPAEDAILAKFVNIPLVRWRELAGRPIGPLYGWQLFDCSNEVRLGHPVMIESIEEMIAGRGIRARRSHSVKPKTQGDEQ